MKTRQISVIGLLNILNVGLTSLGFSSINFQVKSSTTRGITSRKQGSSRIVYLAVDAKKNSKYDFSFVCKLLCIYSREWKA